MQLLKKEVFSLSLLLLVVELAVVQSRRVIRAAPGEETTGNYIIVLAPETNHSRFETIVDEVKNESVNHTIYVRVEGPFAKIVAAKISEEAAHRLSQLDGVELIEEETYAHGSISWAMDRINQIDKKLDGHSNSHGDGQGVDIYLLDSGINYKHCEFGTRALFPGYDPLDKVDGTNMKGKDCHGHGTHVASVAAGAMLGVANKATVYSVRVLSCNNRTPWSVVIDGLNYAGEQAVSRDPHHPSVILMPLEGPVSVAINRSLNAILNRNISVVGAAGNKRENACYSSPANTPGVITVASSNSQDGVFSYTNAGPCVDIFAPGVLVIGANYFCSACTCTSSQSGSSLSAALVVGVIALYLQQDPSLLPAEIKEKLVQSCIKNVLDFRDLPPNLATLTSNYLLYINSSDIGNSLAPTKVVTETVMNPSPTSNAVCCEMLKKFENIERSLDTIVEKGIDKMTHFIQGNITSLLLNTSSPPCSNVTVKSTNTREHILPTNYRPGSAVKSCQDLSYYSELKSGYYPIITKGGNEVIVYCELEKVIKGYRGFMRIAYVNMSIPNTECPQGLSLREDEGLRTCQREREDPGCSSTYFSSSNIQYSRVYGRINGYQWSSPNAFYETSRNQQSTINDPFVDGAVLTHMTKNGRQHIWTFAAAADEIGRSTPFACQCTNRDDKVPVNIPTFVGNDYFCETGSHAHPYTDNTLYKEDPLWDGEGCGEVDTCCKRGEWFIKDIPKTTSNVELRLCGNEDRSNEDTPLEIIELYVQ